MEEADTDELQGSITECATVERRGQHKTFAPKTFDYLPEWL
jgi:hypothetical protein